MADPRVIMDPNLKTFLDYEFYHPKDSKLKLAVNKKLHSDDKQQLWLYNSTSKKVVYQLNDDSFSGRVDDRLRKVVQYVQDNQTWWIVQYPDYKAKLELQLAWLERKVKERNGKKKEKRKIEYRNPAKWEFCIKIKFKTDHKAAVNEGLVDINKPETTAEKTQKNFTSQPDESILEFSENKGLVDDEPETTAENTQKNFTSQLGEPLLELSEENDSSFNAESTPQSSSKIITEAGTVNRLTKKGIKKRLTYDRLTTREEIFQQCQKVWDDHRFMVKVDCQDPRCLLLKTCLLVLKDTAIHNGTGVWIISKDLFGQMPEIKDPKIDQNQIQHRQYAQGFWLSSKDEGKNREIILEASQLDAEKLSENIWISHSKRANQIRIGFRVYEEKPKDKEKNREPILEASQLDAEQ